MRVDRQALETRHKLKAFGAAYSSGDLDGLSRRERSNGVVFAPKASLFPCAAKVDSSGRGVKKSVKEPRKQAGRCRKRPVLMRRSRIVTRDNLCFEAPVMPCASSASPEAVALRFLRRGQWNETSFFVLRCHEARRCLPCRLFRQPQARLPHLPSENL